MQGALSVALDDIFPQHFDQPLFADLANDYIANQVGKIDSIVDRQVVSVQVEKILQGSEGAALVPLHERMIAPDPDHERHCQHDGILFAVMPIVDGFGERALKQVRVEQPVWFACFGDRQLVEFD